MTRLPVSGAGWDRKREAARRRRRAVLATTAFVAVCTAGVVLVWAGLYFLAKAM